MIESEVGVDIRKSLFYTLAERKWPLIGMEALGMNLEDIFITIVDQSSAKARYERRAQRTRTSQGSIESEIAKNIMAKTEKDKAELSDLFGDDQNNG